MKELKTIFLILYPSLSVDRAIRRGVNQYALSTDKRWNVLASRTYIPSVETFQNLVNSCWDLAGVIGSIDHEDIARAAAKLPFPLVNTSGNQYPSLLEAPTVGLDFQTIGMMAGEYLADLGFQRIAFLGASSTREMLQLAGFRDALGKRGLEPLIIQQHDLEQRLADIPKPIAVFATNDDLSCKVSLACRLLELAVPEEVAILGVGHDELDCNGVHPPLSSIRLPGEKIGFEAARIMDQMLQGKKPLKSPLFLPPEGVEVRQSTNILAITDSRVADGMRFIRENVFRPISVEEVAREASLSSPHLERRFRKVIGRTIFQEIRRVQIDQAKRLLRETDLTVDKVAERSGLIAAPQLGRAFRKAMQISPGAYRNQFRNR